LKDAPHHNPGVTLQPGHLAYCIYTSGSTGRPKGVLVSHEAICNLLHDMQNGLDLQPTDILLSIAPATFDIFGLDFYLPLTTGTVLLLANPKQVKDPVAITRLCDIHRVTILQATPSAWRMLKDGKFNAPLKFALSSGETMGQDIAKWLPHVAKHVWNLYGPTETTIWSSKVLRSDADSAITIGKPITNTRLYILDQQLNPVPVGVPGELYIAGAGLARGYLKQPGQTAERFIPDPYGPAGSRMYRTGDRTKYLPNGEIDYIGRLDRQVKIRGFRIETGEIEAALLTNGLCRNAVLMTHVWGENPQLVAYVVPGTANQPNEFRAALKRTLPDYMIPTVWVLLSTLPLNTNGKIDYKALPAPERPVTDITAPRTLTEKRVAKVWGEVLEVDQVGIHDNFFALWGHSLLATKIAAQLSQIFGQTLSMRMLFDFPTIAELSNMLDKTCGEALGTTPVHTIQRQARIPCQHPLPTKK
jgi:amino acid adenylation domain-containing protein